MIFNRVSKEQKERLVQEEVVETRAAGLEPATFGSVDRCSIQLSYARSTYNHSLPFRGGKSRHCAPAALNKRLKSGLK